MTVPDPNHATHIVDTTMFWSPAGGGVGRYLRTKHAWFAKRIEWRHSIVVPSTTGGSSTRAPATFESASDPTQPAALISASLPSLPLPGSGGYRLPLDRRAIAQALVDTAPDLIEAGDPYRVAWGALDASQTLGIPSVAYCHSNLERVAQMAAGRWLGSTAAAIARRYARHLYARFDLVLAPSRSMQQHLLSWGVDHAQCQPLGVDSALFHPSRASSAWREANGFDTDARVLVYAGRFAAEKHLDVLAAAVERLGAPYVLLVIGAGPMPPPAGERVKVLPFVADGLELATALASADAFVHAGDQETFGLSVLEAMACGTPVVARHAEGLAELVDDTVGVSVRRGDAAAFAEAIASLFEADIAARGAAARVRAERSDWEAVLPDLAARYRSLLTGSAGRLTSGESAALGTRVAAR